MIRGLLNYTKHPFGDLGYIFRTSTMEIACYFAALLDRSALQTPIWKRQFANGKHPIGGLYRTFFEFFFFFNFHSHVKDSKQGRKCIFINCTSCNRSPQQISFQFANGKLPHSRCRAFWARTCGQNNLFLVIITTYKRKFLLRNKLCTSSSINGTAR